MDVPSNQLKSDPPRLSASERHRSLEMKAAVIAQTAQSIQNTAAPTPAILDRLHLLTAELHSIRARTNKRWGELQEQQRQLAQLVHNAEASLQHEQRRVDENLLKDPDPAKHPTILKAKEDVAAARAALEQGNELFASPDAALETIAPELDILLERLRELYQDAVQDTSLARAGVEVVEVSRDEFQQGLKYHRSQARWLLFLMLSLALAGGAGVVALFSELGGWHPGPVEVASNGTQAWIHLGLILGGRFSVLLGLGWLLVFAGRMHSRHAQQAVTYQERLMGLDAAKMVIHHGTGPVREQLLQQLTTTFLSLDGNAFKPEPRGPRSRFSLRELRQVTRALAELRRPPDVANARKSRRGSTADDG